MTLGSGSQFTATCLHLLSGGHESRAVAVKQIQLQGAVKLPEHEIACKIRDMATNGFRSHPPSCTWYESYEDYKKPAQSEDRRERSAPCYGPASCIQLRLHSSSFAWMSDASKRRPSLRRFRYSRSISMALAIDPATDAGPQLWYFVDLAPLDG